MGIDPEVSGVPIKDRIVAPRNIAEPVPHAHAKVEKVPSLRLAERARRPQGDPLPMPQPPAPRRATQPPSFEQPKLPLVRVA
jgi:hypothetical protein